ncbi:type IV fimbrial biogenesis protein FimT [Pseudomonas anguilliseptica]|uniref:Type II secretion system protein H n=1 Tax=Pseudomonas anguilliseptica TaxID=53406 RepID=A0A1H5AI42_PSEAG|nr:type IV fimbrial biogenesis protein FimT [Pseudomonas anguilliseptica]
MNRRYKVKLFRGFTLVELMITIAVAGVLLAIAVPSFTDLIRNNRSQAAANELVSAFNAARAEAVKRGRRVSLCPSVNGTSCSGTAWQSGWIVFVDTAASDTTSTATVGTVLNHRSAMPTGATATGSATFIRYSGLGFAPVRQNITVQTSSCTGQNARLISFSSSGRINVQKVACT